MKMSKFQIIVLAIFVVCIIGGVAAFALYRGNTNTTTLPSITIWGTFPSNIFSNHVAAINNGLSQSITVNYVQKSASSFGSDFINALARGKGPDAILVPSDMLLPQQDKLVAIPYSALPQRDFMNTYIQEANIYLTQNGELAVPFTMDPLVMYWNRDTFNSAGLATYPRYWDEFPALASKLTQKDQNGNVRRSAVAMGVFSNITNAREILGSLLMQSGNPITGYDKSGQLSSTLKLGASADPTKAIQFFIQFANPTSPTYSWNRGLNSDKSAFLSGTLATYFGYASELNDIRNKNPNLNFDVAPLPQLRSNGVKAGYAKMYGFSLVKASPNANGAFQVISIITAPQYLSTLSQTMYLPTVRTDLIAQGSTDPYISVFNEQALVSKTWIDADPAKSRDLMANMIEYITSGQKSANQAVDDAGNQYDLLLKQAIQ